MRREKGMISISNNVAGGRSRRALERNPANCINTITTWKLIPLLRAAERAEMIEISRSAPRLPSYSDFLCAQRDRFYSRAFVHLSRFTHNLSMARMRLGKLCAACSDG